MQITDNRQSAMGRFSKLIKSGSVEPAAESPSPLEVEVQRLRRENRALVIALEEMERIAQRDVLTSLFNRRYFMTALQQRIARVQRYGEDVALIYVDVNGLKAINDRYGHHAGDRVLIEIGRRLLAAMRESDVVARIGGDEFALLIDHVDAAAAQTKITQLHRAISATTVQHRGEDIALSAAFGMSMIGPDHHADDLLTRADEDMYRAKRAAD